MKILFAILMTFCFTFVNLGQTVEDITKKKDIWYEIAKTQHYIFKLNPAKIQKDKDILVTWVMMLTYPSAADQQKTIYNIEINCELEQQRILEAIVYKNDEITENQKFEDAKFETSPPDSAVRKIINSVCLWHAIQ